MYKYIKPILYDYFSPEDDIAFDLDEYDSTFIWIAQRIRPHYKAESIAEIIAEACCDGFGSVNSTESYLPLAEELKATIISVNKIKKISLWNNSYLSFIHEASVDFANYHVFYKTNCYQGGQQFYEAFFLADKYDLKKFEAIAYDAEDWADSYGQGYTIDGKYWKVFIEYADGAERKIEGYNSEPDNFDNFLYYFEMGIQRSLRYK